MRKYWKTIVISLVIVTAISSYYIQLAWASKNETSLTLETISGNKEEIDNLMIQGSYEERGVYQLFDLSKDSSANPGNSSFIKSLIIPHAPLMIQNYIEEHRHFMRGKEYNLSQYVEDKSRLIYATIPDKDRLVRGELLTLQIDMLDKITNERTTFEVKTAVKARYDWTNVYDVHVEDEKIKILVMCYLTNGDEELHIYTIDVNNQELEDDTIITQTKSDNSYIRLNYNVDEIEKEKYYVYQVEEYSDLTEDDRSEITHSQMYLYNISTSEVEELDIPSDLKPFTSSTIIKDVEIIIPVQSANAIEVNRYNIEQKYWEEPVSFTIQSTFNKEQEPFLRFMDGKLYSVYQVSDGYRLLIGDVRTGKSLYEGNIVRNHNEMLNEINSFYIEQMYILH